MLIFLFKEDSRMEQYKAELILYSENYPIERKIQVRFKASLYDLATFLFTSLMEKEVREKYSFLFRFDDTIYLTKKEEQETGYGYSDGTYHLLDEESFLNVVLRNPKKLFFELSDYSAKGNLVFPMSVTSVTRADDEDDIVLLDGKNILGENRKEESVPLSSIAALIQKDWKEVKKENRYRD